MQLHLKISREQGGEWLFKGLSNHASRHFGDLSEGLAWAQHECSAAPAQIEIWIGSLYVFIQQERGWPRKICGAIPEAKARSGDRPTATRPFGRRLRQALARWRKSIVANAAAYSSKKGEVVLRAASILFSRRAVGQLHSGKSHTTSPWA